MQNRLRKRAPDAAIFFSFICAYTHLLDKPYISETGHPADEQNRVEIFILCALVICKNDIACHRILQCWCLAPIQLVGPEFDTIRNVPANILDGDKALLIAIGCTCGGIQYFKFLFHQSGSGRSDVCARTGERRLDDHRDYGRKVDELKDERGEGSIAWFSFLFVYVDRSRCLGIEAFGPLGKAVVVTFYMFHAVQFGVRKVCSHQASM